MKKLYLFLLIPMLALTACLEKTQSVADDQSPIKIEQPYAFATMPGGSTGAAFMIIHNEGEIDDRLINAQSNIAEITEIHENLIDPDDGTMMMRKIRGLDIPADGKEILEPKGYHIMFIKLKEPLTMGQSVPVTLEFEQAGLKKIDVDVLAPGVTPDMQDAHHHGHQH
jgi:hypothetical protein